MTSLSVYPFLLHLTIGDLVSNNHVLELKHDMYPIDDGVTLVDLLCRSRMGPKWVKPITLPAHTPFLVMGPWAPAPEEAVVLLTPDGRLFLEFDGDGSWHLEQPFSSTL